MSIFAFFAKIENEKLLCYDTKPNLNLQNIGLFFTTPILILQPLVCTLNWKVANQPKMFNTLQKKCYKTLFSYNVRGKGADTWLTPMNYEQTFINQSRSLLEEYIDELNEY